MLSAVEPVDVELVPELELEVVLEVVALLLGSPGSAKGLISSVGSDFGLAPERSLP